MAASRSLSAAAAAGEAQFPCDPTNCTAPSKVCFYEGCIDFPPSPPPFLVPSDADGGGGVRIAVSNSRRLVSVFLISAASLLAAAFLLLLLSYFLLRLRRRRRRLRRQQQQQQQQQEAHHPAPVDGDEFFNDDGNGEPHHVWYIRTVGLDDAVIKSIAAFVYKSGDGLVDGGDCSVCLGEFSDGEVVKLLPKCSHAFHQPCVDTWLRSHVNCPLCRAPVVVPAAGAETPAAADGSVSGRLENTQIEISQPQNQDECAITINLDAGSSSSLSRPLDDENELQPIRRSVSMDSSSLAKLMLRVESEPEVKLGEEKREIEVQGVILSKKKGEGVDCFGKQSVERSLSSRSGRLFFPRCRRGRARSSSVLPL